MKDRNVTEFRPAFETLEVRECFSALPYGGYAGGVFVAAGDVNNDVRTPGVNVAMTDGSVRFIKDSISMAGVVYVGGSTR
jgi:prepilin-type processing-associated H-X9-DG protein